MEAHAKSRIYFKLKRDGGYIKKNCLLTLATPLYSKDTLWDVMLYIRPDKGKYSMSQWSSVKPERIITVFVTISES